MPTPVVGVILGVIFVHISVVSCTKDVSTCERYPLLCLTFRLFINDLAQIR